MQGAMVVVLLLGAVAQKPPEGGMHQWLTQERAEKLLVRLVQRIPFAQSEHARSEKERKTMGLFFGAKDYALLRGNPVLGYWSAAGFRWTGNRVAWDGVVSKGPSCRRITKAAWDVAFAYVARKHGLVVDGRAPIRMHGACVRAVIESTPADPIRGVLMEMRVDSPTGAFRWRYSRGNPTIEGAVGASVELPVLIGQRVNKEGWPRGW